MQCMWYEQAWLLRPLTVHGVSCWHGCDEARLLAHYLLLLLRLASRRRTGGPTCSSSSPSGWTRLAVHGDCGAAQVVLLAANTAQSTLAAFRPPKHVLIIVAIVGCHAMLFTVAVHSCQTVDNRCTPRLAQNPWQCGLPFCLTHLAVHL